jgi:serine/threonine-protein kinase
LHITARLVNAADGHQYYSHAYEHEVPDAFTVSREIAAHAANVLRVREDAQEVARFTKSPGAYQKYLEGFHHASWTRESELREAITSYQQAISFDPNYSPAYVGLSDAYVLLALLNEAPAGEAMRRAAEAARAAVKTGGSYAHAHAALGSVMALYEWDWAGAEKEFRKAIDGDPNDSAILQQYAMRCLAPQANLDSALFHLRVAQQVDPLSPEAVFNRGRVFYFKGDFVQALGAFRSALELDSHLETAPLAIAETHLRNSSFAQAIQQLLESSVPTEDEARLAILGSAYGLSGRPNAARQVLQQLLQVDRHRHLSGFYMAQIYLALGEIEPALASLEAAAEERSPLVVYVNVAPQFERLRAEPRFHALLKRIKLER